RGTGGAPRGIVADAASAGTTSPSAEGEDVGAHARVEERDLEGALGVDPRLADELVHPRLGDRARARPVDVQAVGLAGGPAVELHREADRVAGGRRREDEVD